MTSLLVKMANVLGNADDVNCHTTLSENIKSAFSKECFDAEGKSYDNNTQFANMFPLYLGIVFDNEKRMY